MEEYKRICPDVRTITRFFAQCKRGDEKICPYFWTETAVCCGQKQKGRCLAMRGYFTPNGFYGLVDGEYRLFASESDYYEFMSSDDAA